MKEIVQIQDSIDLQLILGYLNDLSGRNSNGDSKLRFTFKSKWTQSLNPQNS